jgi:hypothetical protein
MRRGTGDTPSWSRGWSKNPSASPLHSRSLECPNECPEISDHGIDILIDSLVSDTEKGDVHRSNCTFAQHIPDLRLRSVVTEAVNLDGQPQFRTIEVDDELQDPMLPTKLETAKLTASEPLP